MNMFLFFILLVQMIGDVKKIKDVDKNLIVQVAQDEKLKKNVQSESEKNCEICERHTWNLVKNGGKETSKMNYFVISGMVINLPAIEKTALNRLHLFEDNGAPAKIVSVLYIPDHCKSLSQLNLTIRNHVNLYDYFQNAQGVIYSKPVTHENRSSSTEIYDSRGFKSCVVTLSEKGRKKIERFLSPEGKLKIEKFYDDYASSNLKKAAVVTRIILHEDDCTFQLNSENELIAHFLDCLALETSENGTSFFIDRSAWYTDAVYLMKTYPALYSVMHNNHVIENRYKRHCKKIFANPSRFSGLICSTVSQAEDIRRIIESKIPVISIPVGISDWITSDSLGFSERQKGKIMMAVRLAKEKRVEDAITAFKKATMYENFPQESTLYIYGKGHLLTSLRKQAKQLGIGHRVVFAGFSGDILKEMRSSELMLLTSVFEGFCLSLMEAMCCNLPAISYDVKYGPSDVIVDGETGLLAEDGNTDDLAEKIVRIITDDELRNNFSRNCDKYKNKFFSLSIFEKFKPLLNGGFHSLANENVIAQHKTSDKKPIFPEKKIGK